MDHQIREAGVEDYPAILDLAREVAREADAYAWESPSDEELAHYWLPDPAHGFDTFVCDAEGEGIVGVYVINPASGGRGAHIAHGSYTVRASHRGNGLGKQLVAHSLAQARGKGYKGMRINMVVSSNVAALRVCRAVGFQVLCTLPGAFKHPTRGLLDTHIMFIDLREDAIASVKVASPVLSYPAAAGGAIFAAGDQCRLSPLLSGGASGASDFRIEPALPAGLVFDPETGAVSGVPREPQERNVYRVSARIHTEFELTIQEERLPAIDEDFAALVETAKKVEDLVSEPSKVRAFGDWMIWMVHRAFLNDPSLVDFDFTNSHMPPGHVEPRIAPKLMAAMRANTHIEVLALANANVQKLQAQELAESLCENVTLRTLNLECNCLDSAAVRELALAIKDNPSLPLQHVRFSHQKQMGQFFGRPTEEAVGQMMERNNQIVKLGFECDDAHWRNIIDRALLRNNDALRRSQAPAGGEELPVAEERSLGTLLLQRPPLTEAPWCDMCELYRSYVVATSRLPTTVQLQNCARNSGSPLPYSVAAPLVKECRSWFLNASLSREVVVVDSFGSSAAGVLTAWSESNDRWGLELTAEGRRLVFKGDREPSFAVSETWLEWLECRGKYGGA